MKIGEVWYLRADNSYGYEEAIGRPCLIISGDEKKMVTDDPGIVTVAFMTTNPRPMGINVPLKSPRRASWVLCNQLSSVDGRRFRDKMCDVTEEELEAVKHGLKIALKLTDDEPEEDILNLKVELDTYKRMYERVLNLLVEKRVEKDVVIPEPPKVDVDVEKLKHQMCTPNALTEDELNYNPVKTKLKPEPVKTGKNKANINTDDWQTIWEVTGMSEQTAKNIVKCREIYGRYNCVDDLLVVPRFGTGLLNKNRGKLEI